MDDVVMPEDDGRSVGDLWYGFPANSTLATHAWDGRSWRPLLADEDYLKATITALRAEVERLRAALERAASRLAECNQSHYAHEARAALGEKHE